MEDNIYQNFKNWLDSILNNNNNNNNWKEIKAFNFNLYEDKNNYQIQLVGTDTFNLENDDWACNEIYSSGIKFFIISKNIAGKEWQSGLNFCKELILKYLQQGNLRNILKEKEAITIGFVDGDLEILYRKN